MNKGKGIFLYLVSIIQSSCQLTFSYFLIQKQRFNEQLLSLKHRLSDGSSTVIQIEFLYSMITGITISFGEIEITNCNIQKSSMKRMLDVH